MAYIHHAVGAMGPDAPHGYFPSFGMHFWTRHKATEINTYYVFGTKITIFGNSVEKRKLLQFIKTIKAKTMHVLVQR